MKNCNECRKQNQTGVFVGPDPLMEAIRRDVRERIEKIITEERDAYLGAGDYERTEERRGYRHGAKEREISTPEGHVELAVPRGRLFRADGDKMDEWHSHILPRYARRAKSIDRALIGMYLGGVNTRRVKAVLRPLLRGTPLSKSAISRLVSRLTLAFKEWQKRSLSAWKFQYAYLDAIFVKSRFNGRVSSIPILAVIGVSAKGEKVLISLSAKGSESSEAWQGVVGDLVARGLKKPKLVIIDGGQGLRAAVERVWPQADVQRCAVHKLRNLLSHAPKHAHDEIRDDFHAIVYASDFEIAETAYEAMVKKWRKQGAAVAESLEEAGKELLTFFRYPESQWKALRTTNAIERLNLEFRRRVKTQASFPSQESTLILMFGLVASGLVVMNRIHGWEDMAHSSSPLRPNPEAMRIIEKDMLMAA
jgi:transposase-like protein